MNKLVAKSSQVCRTALSRKPSISLPKVFFSCRCMVQVCESLQSKGVTSKLHSKSFSSFKRFEGGISVSENADNDISKDARSNEVLPSIPGSKTSNEVMIIVFTCTVCNTRTARKMSKDAYNNGVVLIRCPGCNNLHLIADHLGYFDDNSINIEKILEQKGEKVTRMDDKQVMEFLRKEELS